VTTCFTPHIVFFSLFPSAAGGEYQAYTWFMYSEPVTLVANRAFVRIGLLIFPFSMIAVIDIL
jgi:hypothetical protein